jgi:uncharacterized repeat protein (TIGR02059 family)
MKGLFIALFLIINSLVSAKTYYVSTTGKDSNPGTFSQPWHTWNYAFNNTTPGDTCYFRGGVYTDMYNASYGVYLNTESRNGTYSQPTSYFAYPEDWAAENYPVLDCQSLSGQYRSAILIAKASHLFIKGLTFKNILQSSYATQVRGFYIHNNFNEPADNVNDIRIENCVVHNASGQGFFTTSCDTIRFINCDAYNCCDSLSTITGYDPGGWGMGFGTYSINPNSYIYLYGCRAWNCSDQGFASNVKGYVEWDHCWSIHNGFYWFETSTGSKGSGWKSEVDLTSYKNTDILQMYMHNCLAVDNEIQGFNTNDGEGDPEFRAHFYNNFSYRNGYEHQNGTRWGTGFIDFARNPSDTVGLWDHVYVNNLSYNNWCVENSTTKSYPADFIQDGSYNPERTLTNYWDISGTTVTDADFISLDTTGLCGPRQKDGSLPDTDFGKLAPTSKLIDAGTDVGLSGGDIADIGWFESSSKSISKPVYVSSSIENVTPSRLEMTYNLTLANIVPPTSSFAVLVNSSVRAVNSVAISGTKVLLTLASPVVYGDFVTVSYTKPGTNPLQTLFGGQASSMSAQSVINNCSLIPNEPPAISISSPTKSTSFIAPATITIDAIASDSDGTIIKVEFYNGTSKIGESTSAPYSCTWKEVADGIYTITAVATDDKNAKTVSSPVSVTVVKSETVVNQLPVVTITTPSNSKNKKYKKNDKIVIVAEASDPDGSISNVEFKNGSATLAVVKTPPYTYTWNVTDTGTFKITAIATDNLGATSVSSELELLIDFVYNSDLINLYPNPNDGLFTIDLISELPEIIYKVAIVNLAGKTVYLGTLNDENYSNEIDISNLASGTYILIIDNDQNIVATKKFIKK